MKQKTLIAGALMLALSTVAAMAADTNKSPERPAMTLPKTVNELIKIDSVQGSGVEALPLNNVSVHYTGWLYDPSQPEGHGKKFDSSKDRGQPFDFFLGGGQVIRGCVLADVVAVARYEARAEQLQMAAAVEIFSCVT